MPPKKPATWTDFTQLKEPFHEACAGGQIEPVQEFWQGAGAKWLCDKRGISPLSLINAEGTDKARPGWTPIFYAATSGSAEVVRFLIECGCDCSHRDQYSQTATAYAKGNHIRVLVGSEHKKSAARDAFAASCDETRCQISEAERWSAETWETDAKSVTCQGFAPKPSFFERRDFALGRMVHMSKKVAECATSSSEALTRASASFDELSALKHNFFGGIALPHAKIEQAKERFVETCGEGGEAVVDAKRLCEVTRSFFGFECHDPVFFKLIVLSYDSSCTKASLTLDEFTRSLEELDQAVTLRRLERDLIATLTHHCQSSQLLFRRLLLTQHLPTAKETLMRVRECLHLTSSLSSKLRDPPAAAAASTAAAAAAATLAEMDHQLSVAVEAVERRRELVAALQSGASALAETEAQLASRLKRGGVEDTLKKARELVGTARRLIPISSPPPVLDSECLRGLLITRCGRPGRHGWRSKQVCFDQRLDQCFDV